MKTSSFSNQLRWVILLLAAVVILPTVCLLWFMNQAVKNERLAVRQKLVDLYTEKIEDANRELNAYWDNEFAKKKMLLANSDAELLELLCSERVPAIVYNQQQEKIYPLFDKDIYVPDPTKVFSEGWDDEFVHHNYEKAISEYQRIADSNDLYQQLDAKSAMARCYKKLNKKSEAIAIYLEIAEESAVTTCDNACLQIIANAQLYLAKESFLATPLPTQLSPEVEHAVALLNYRNDAGSTLSVEQKYFIAQTIAQNISFNDFGDTDTLAALSGTLSCCKSVLTAFSCYSSDDSLEALAHEQLQHISDGDKNYYVAKIQGSNRTALFVYQDMWPVQGGLVGSVKYYKFATRHTDLAFRIVDAQKNYITGAQEVSSAPFLSMPMSPYFPEWKVELYPTDTELIENSARQRAAIYLWTGILVALLILSAGAVSIRAVNQQIKINRLKNDFIATVTHELKTPLASMRLLVDTLLEGNYEGEQTATEYLQLVANENKRLTHLIDSFLTFSRMERNKQVFELASASPVEIANLAIEAVRPKYDNGKVDFEIDVQKPLPVIRADKDGMVTVLVNLLDNAYKYTNSDKHIKLCVYEENGSVCFAVKDNGIGLSPRAQRKIFNRFYQVDSRLSRRTEGCGLGLSIVKFIVDAHKGQIEVESKPGEGSIFTIRLPVV